MTRLVMRGGAYSINVVVDGVRSARRLCNDPMYRNRYFGGTRLMLGV